MNQQEGRLGGALALNRNVSGLLPDKLFARMLAVVIACVTIPEMIALAIASDAHRSSLLGSFFMLLPPLVCGVYFISRSLTQPLAKLTAETDSLGRRAEMGAVTPPCNARRRSRAKCGGTSRPTSAVMPRPSERW